MGNRLCQLSLPWLAGSFANSGTARLPQQTHCRLLLSFSLNQLVYPQPHSRLAKQLHRPAEPLARNPHKTQIMDTPRPEQIRPLQPEAEAATDEDCLELMEMILGALGRCVL
jgi:hypothetical protein